MRTIKFRGKTEGGKWLYGCFLFQNGKPQIVSFAGLYTWNVLPETVGQSTGLFDKNGKGIYEGDIVRAFNTEEETVLVGKVEFADYCFVIAYPKYPSLALFEIGDDINIIGNIHDNPELYNP